MIYYVNKQFLIEFTVTIATCKCMHDIIIIFFNTMVPFRITKDNQTGYVIGRGYLMIDKSLHGVPSGFSVRSNQGILSSLTLSSKNVHPWLQNSKTATVKRPNARLQK